AVCSAAGCEGSTCRGRVKRHGCGGRVAGALNTERVRAGKGCRVASPPASSHRWLRSGSGSGHSDARTCRRTPLPKTRRCSLTRTGGGGARSGRGRGGERGSRSASPTRSFVPGKQIAARLLPRRKGGEAEADGLLSADDADVRR